MRINVRYEDLGVEVNATPESSRQEIAQAYFAAKHDMQYFINNFIQYASFKEDTIEDAIIIEDNGDNRANSKEDSN